MITGKTQTGFSFCVKKRKVHSRGPVEAIAKIEAGTAMLNDFISCAKMILEDGGYDKLWDHCDEISTDERYPDECFGAELSDILNIIIESDNETKNL